jgi:heptosyltransferase-2
MKILVIQTAFIGDVILATPLIRGVIEAHPRGQVDVLVRKGNESLLKGFPGISHVLTWDKKNSKNRQLLNLLSTIRLSGYDTVVNLQRFGATGLLTAFSGARERIGFDKNPWSFLFSRKIAHCLEGSHETQRNLELISHWTQNADPRPVLYPSPDDFQEVAAYQSLPYRCIAPASVWATKQVPKEQWRVLITALLNKYLNEPVFLLGGPDDTELCEGLFQASNHRQRVINLAGKLTFLQTAALMRSARMNYVNDSAPMHIASAMNAPVTAFFCSTVPSFGFGPLSDERVIAEVNGLSCRPCGLHGHNSCPKKHFRCALDLNMTTYV